MGEMVSGAEPRVCRIVYCGPSESGKTTNLQALERALLPHARGKLVKIDTETDRTLYFDLLSVEFGGLLGGVARARFELFTVPGQTFYLTARRRILREADGIVFVVDSRRERVAANIEALAEVVAAIQDAGREPAEIPALLQLNKRDAPSALPAMELLRAIGCDGEPFIEAIAHQGQGVVETLRLISRRSLAGQFFPEAVF